MDKIQQEVDMIRHYRLSKFREGEALSPNEAANSFIDKYAVRYSDVWYDGITSDELKEKLFG